MRVNRPGRPDDDWQQADMAMATKEFLREHPAKAMATYSKLSN